MAPASRQCPRLRRFVVAIADGSDAFALCKCALFRRSPACSLDCSLARPFNRSTARPRRLLARLRVPPPPLLSLPPPPLQPPVQAAPLARSRHADELKKRLLRWTARVVVHIFARRRRRIAFRARAVAGRIAAARRPLQLQHIKSATTSIGARARVGRQFACFLSSSAFLDGTRRLQLATLTIGTECRRATCRRIANLQKANRFSAARGSSCKRRPVV